MLDPLQESPRLTRRAASRYRHVQSIVTANSPSPPTHHHANPPKPANTTNRVCSWLRPALSCGPSHCPQRHHPLSPRARLPALPCRPGVGPRGSCTCAALSCAQRQRYCSGGWPTHEDGEGGGSSGFTPATGGCGAWPRGARSWQVRGLP